MTATPAASTANTRPRDGDANRQLPRCSAVQTRCGVIGRSRWSMPRAASASSTAFIADGSEPATPDSPAPLTPSGLVVHGTTWWPSAQAAAVVRARHHVVHERRGDELAVLAVDDLLAEHLAEPLRDAAVDLPLDDGLRA